MTNEEMKAASIRVLNVAVEECIDGSLIDLICVIMGASVLLPQVIDIDQKELHEGIVCACESMIETLQAKEQQS